MADPIEAIVDARKELLSALLDQSHECIKLLDAEGRILFVNREGCRAMESSAPDDMLGQNWVDRWPAESRTVVVDALVSGLEGKVVRFSAARPGAAGDTRWWDVTLTPITAQGAGRFLTIARDITAEHREREQVAAITAEMRHRLKNAMTIAMGLVTLEGRSAPEHQAFARQVCERFAQLAHVQELVLDPAADKSLPQIIRMLARVYGDGTLLKIGTLPDVQLSDAATQALALAFGELATNSLKYGALKSAKSIEIAGEAATGMLVLTWHEPTDFGGSRVGGEGLGLVERLLAGAGGQIDREIGPGSLTVRVSLPIVV